MKKNRNTLLLITILGIVALACNMPSAGATETPVAATEDPAATAAPTEEIVETLETEAVPQGVTVTVSTATNCRTGPDAAYQLLMTVQPGGKFDVVGKYTPLNYWIINMPTGGTCWLWGKFASITGDASTLPEIAAPAPPPVAQVDPNANNNGSNDNGNNNDDNSGNDNGSDNSNSDPGQPFIPLIPIQVFILPNNPTDINVNVNCQFQFPSVTQTSTVTWTDAATNETGYVVYKNNVAVANLPPNAQKYVESFNVLGSPGSIKYGVKAVADQISSATIEKTVNTCN